MSIPLILEGLTGRRAELPVGGILEADIINRLNTSGDLAIGVNLGAADVLALGNVAGTSVVQVLGDTELDGTLNVGTGIFQVTAAGAVTANPTAGQNVVLTTLTTGDINLVSADIIDLTSANALNLISTAGNVTLDGGDAGVIVTSNLTATGSLMGHSVVSNSIILLQETGQGSNLKNWALNANTAVLRLTAYSDLLGIGTGGLRMTRTTSTIQLIELTAAVDVAFIAPEVSLTGYMKFVDIAAPGNASAAEGRLYKLTANDGLWWIPDAGGAAVDLTATSGGGGENLQQTYDFGNAIVIAASTPLALSSALVGDMLTVTKTFVGAGRGIVVDMGPANEAVTGIGVDISSGTGATGTMLFVNNLGSGNAFQVQDGGSDVLVVDAAGEFNIFSTTDLNDQDIIAAKTVTFGASPETQTTVGLSTTINWNDGQKQHLNLDETTTTLLFTDPPGIGNFTLVVQQTGGSFEITGWDADIIWLGGTAPTFLDASGSFRLLSFYYDGTRYFGEFNDETYS